jgi:hypothetical protein
MQFLIFETFLARFYQSEVTSPKILIYPGKRRITNFTLETRPSLVVVSYMQCLEYVGVF